MSREVASEPVSKRSSRDLESVLEYASRIRAFAGLVEEEEEQPPPPPLPEPLVLDRTPVELDADEPGDSSREVDDYEGELSSVGRNGENELREKPTSLDSSERAPLERDDELTSADFVPVQKDNDFGQKPTSSDSVDFAPLEREKPTSLDSTECAPLETDEELREKPVSFGSTKHTPLGRDDELTSADFVPVQKDNELGQKPISLDSVDIVPLERYDTLREKPRDDDIREPNLLDSNDELSKKTPLLDSTECAPLDRENEVEKKTSSSDSSSDSSSSTSNSDENGKDDSRLSEIINDTPDVNGTAEEVDLNQDPKPSPGFHNMDSGFSDEMSSTVLLDNEGQKRKEDNKLGLNGFNNDDNLLVEQNGVVNNGFDDEGCVKDEAVNGADDSKTSDHISKDELPSTGETTSGNSIEDEKVFTRPKVEQDTVAMGNEKDTRESQNEGEVGNKAAEVFLFDPEYVESLQNESAGEDAKPIPDMAVLRRLSQDVVNKVLDDAGSQIREIFDERKRSIIELNKNAAAESKNNYGSESMVLRDKEQERPDDMSTWDKKEQDVMDDDDTLCGIGGFHPKWVQPYATAKTYTVLYSIIGMLSGAYYTYLIGTISTLEKRFAFKSKISGTIMIVDEITPLLLGVLVGYFGGKAHRPRMVALGMFLSAVCCFVSAMPYFIYGPATHLNVLNIKNETSLGLCDEGESVQESCDSDDRPPTMAAILFLMLGSFLKGFGNLAYYAIGLAYMDDNAKKKNTPMYFAVSMTLRLVGPLLGFLLSSACLKIYENPFVDPGFGKEDPRWIGAWWMGFILQGVLLFIFVIPIAMFPRRISGFKYPAENINAQVPNFQGLLAALKRLGKNPLFVFIVLNTIMAIFGGFGHYIMLPKYMENQFHMSASDASLLSGPPGLAAVMTSTIIGGSLIWKFKPSAKILTAGMLIVEIIAAFGFLLLMIPQCERIQMNNFGIKDDSLILDSVCNFNCNCSTASYTPVCGSDGTTTFFSPCYAGCSEGQNKTFTNCSCLPEFFGEPSVSEGYCVVENCWSQVLGYIITLPILQLIVSLMRVAHTMILLRSIEPEDKGVALGTFETLLCAFGFIPFPIVYGALVDSTCLVWEESCGRTGNCWFYDVDKFNYLLHGVAASFSAMSVLCLIVIFSLSGRVNNLYEEDEKKEVKGAEKIVDSNVIKI